MPTRCSLARPAPQSAEAGERDEHEPEREAGRAAARRPAAGDDRRALRDPHAAPGAHQERRVLPERGQRGQAGHGGDQGQSQCVIDLFQPLSHARINPMPACFTGASHLALSYSLLSPGFLVIWSN